MPALADESAQDNYRNFGACGVHPLHLTSRTVRYLLPGAPVFTMSMKPVVPSKLRERNKFLPPVTVRSSESSDVAAGGIRDAAANLRHA
jgi:hypothetical protein